MRFRHWAAAAAVISTAVLTACGGSSDSDGSKVDIRLVNASAGYASIDLTVDSVAINSAVAYGTAGAYASVSTSATTSQVLSAGSALASSTPTLTSGYKYSMITYGWPGAVRMTPLQEGEAAPAATYTKLLVLNLASDAGALDIYLSATCTESLDNATPLSSNIAGGSNSGYNTTTAGTYCVRVTGTGKKDTDLRLSIPSVALPSLQVATLIITPTTGGVLVNGMLLVQTAAVTNHPGTNARARVVGALGGNARVAVMRGSTTLLPTSVTPAIGEYATVNAGSEVLTVTVNGTALPVSSPQLAVGGDYTLLIAGTPALPTVTVITDDNRLPTTSGTAKIRLINGLGNLDAGLTMTLDYGAIANNVMPGAASSYATVSASTTSQLTVSSPTFSDAVYNLTDLSIASSGIYNVYLMGDGSALSTIKGVLRKER